MIIVDKKKKIWLTASIGLTTIAGFFSYPSVLRWQIEKRIPGIEFQDARLNVLGVTLTGVKVNKTWVSGELETVTSDFQGQHVMIDGGTINIDFNKRSKEGEGQKKDIQFQNINAQIIYDKYQLSVTDAKSSGNNICFATAELKDPAVVATEGCVDRASKVATVEKVRLSQMEFKGVEVKDLVAHKVKIFAKEKTAEVDSIGAQVTLQNQSFQIEAEKIKASHNPDGFQANLIKVKHHWLSDDWTPLENVVIQHKDKWQLSVGDSQVEIDSQTLGISGSEDCSTWIGSLPASLKSSPLDQIKFTGKTSFTISLHPKPTFNLKSDCKATCSTLPNLKKKFKYTAYTSKHEKFEREGGVGSKGWIPLSAMGEMALAATTMEDPGFQHHRGFITQAFANSFIDNLKMGKFFRGGSTITMQLAKNIWLTRDKTLGRKVQEFFLAQAIESCYSKDEILELYLNAVEFGPDQYGVASGSRYWFKKSPGELLPTEAFWLASILPRPNRTEPPSELSLKRIEDLMKKLAADGRIPYFQFESDDVEIMEQEDLNHE
jgi:hypothetical protein